MTIQLARQPATTANTGGELDSTSTAILPVAKLNVTTQLSETVTTNTSTGTLSDLAWTTGIIRFTTPGAVTLNGVVAPTDGVFLTIVNDGSNPITIPYNAGTAANSFINATQQPILIQGNSAETFRYAGARWRWLGAEYPSWQTFSPSLTKTGGTGTLGASTASVARYSQVGKTVTVELYITGINITVGTITMRISLPVAAKDAFKPLLYGNNNGSITAGVATTIATSTLVAIQPDLAGTAWAVTAGTSEFSLTFSYEAN